MRSLSLLMIAMLSVACSEAEQTTYAGIDLALKINALKVAIKSNLEGSIVTTQKVVAYTGHI
jgi:hypothetical protein